MCFFFFPQAIPMNILTQQALHILTKAYPASSPCFKGITSPGPCSLSAWINASGHSFISRYIAGYFPLDPHSSIFASNYSLSFFFFFWLILQLCSKQID